MATHDGLSEPSLSVGLFIETVGLFMENHKRVAWK